MDTKKDILLRQLRHKRRQRMNDRREALERKSERDYKESYMEEIRRKKDIQTYTNTFRRTQMHTD